MTHHYIKTINFSLTGPTICSNCGQNNFVKNTVISETGTTKDNLTTKDNHLCLYCEGLIIIGKDEPVVSIRKANPDDKVTIVHNAGR